MKLPKQLQEQITAYGRLEKVHRGFAEASEELSQTLGVDLCVSNCGRCCQNVVAVWGIEALYLVSWLTGSGMLSRIVGLAEDWLLEPVPGVNTIVTIARQGQRLSEEERKDLSPELETLMHTPCPFLSNNSCLIYEARPIVCRAFGVTRMASKDCPRPLGHGEFEGVRAYYGGNGQQRLKAEIGVMLATVKDIQPFMCQSGLLPTMLYRAIRGNKLTQLVAEGKIAAAKLAFGIISSPALLWQEQLEEHWRTMSFRPN